MILRHSSHRISNKLLAVLFVITAVTLACNLPFISNPTPSAKETTPAIEQKAAPREPLPPVVVETSPLPSATLPMSGAVSLTFDQPMDRESVEAAVKVEPAIPGRFEWQEDTIVSFIPDQPLSPEMQLTITIADTALSANGLNLLRTTSYNFQTTGALKAVERLPQPGTIDANPSSSVAVTFNLPVAELGEVEAPVAFTLEPEVEGRGYWLNTSTYIFEPDPAMGGGVQYRVKLNPDITSLGGANLADGTNFDWSFTTTPPALLEVWPAAGTILMLDEEFRLTFNQPMDTTSVEQNFSLRDAADNQVIGKFIWSKRDTVVTFQPDGLLRRGNSYFLELARRAKSRGGTEMLISTRTEYQSVGKFGLSSTKPAQGQPLQLYSGFGSIVLNFNAPLAQGQDLSILVEIEPKPGDYKINLSTDGKAIYLSGSFIEGTNYHVTLAGSLQDKWGSTLGVSFSTNFMVSDSTSRLSVPLQYTVGKVLFARPGDSTLPAYATNLSTLNISRVRLTLPQFLDLIYKYDLPSVDLFDSPDNWTQTLSLPRNISQGIDIDLTPGEESLQDGLYVYSVNSPDLPPRTEGYNFGLVSSRTQITIKQGQDEVFLWVTNLQTGEPIADSPVQIYNAAGDPAAVGTTSSDGTARIALRKLRENYRGLVVVVGTPESPDFGVGISTWTRGVAPWDMGILSRPYKLDMMGYIYTDRPIYRPGQTVNFRAVLRTPDDARYTIPEFDTATFLLYNWGEYYGYDETQPLDSVQLEFSPYGTVSGEFTLPDDADPGTYSIQLENQNPRVVFQVAEYRKPEIDVQVNFAQAEYRAGSDIRMEVQTEYYFGGAVKDASVRWTLYTEDEYFYIPGGYTTGLVDTSWLNPVWYEQMGYYGSSYLTSGEGVTNTDGTLSLVFTAAELARWLEPSKSHVLKLQAEVVDESGMSVSVDGSTVIHPDDYYIGIKPDSWIGKAGDSMGFTIQTVDWMVAPVSDKNLSAVFQKVEWVQDWSNVQLGRVVYKEQLTDIGSVDFRTDGSGKARIAFDVPEPGSYRLDVHDGQAVSQILLWVGGTGSVPWPALPDQTLRLQSDFEVYSPGDQAQIFIPNPFPQGAKALLTVERQNVRHYEIFDIDGSSTTIDLEIKSADAPNVFVSVLLLGKSTSGNPDFRLGYLQLDVDAQALLLDVELTFEETTLEPGQTASAVIQVRDSAGNPVQGEFSMAVVDKSIFALTDTNVKDIASYFYGVQPISVTTSTSLVGYTQRIITTEPALGAGGGGSAEPINDPRENFQDTAYWSGSFETDVNGMAVIEFPMPDNLTTWVVTVRGLTRDTRVGEAVTELLVTKDLIIRPVTPRFLVAGDRVQLGAVINNNTGETLDVAVELEAVGVNLQAEDAALAVQVPAGGRKRVNWWVDVQDAGTARLVFSARSGNLRDASTPVMGDIPILHYSSPQTFATSGLMKTSGENLEVVSLPKSFQPTGGELRIEMNSSLAGAVISSLEVMDTYPTEYTEPIISHLMANLAGYNLLKESGSSQPDLLARYQKAIRNDLDRLAGLQNSNGGYGWGPHTKSDLYLSSYALLTLSWTQDAGFIMRPNVIEKTREYVYINSGVPDSKWQNWQLDRLAMAYYALVQAGASGFEPERLYPLRERLSPWAKALLALSLVPHDTQMTDTLLSDLQSNAVRSATGLNWQGEQDGNQNFATPNFNTAVAIYALSTRDPASPSLADAVRYLVFHRRANGGWYSSYDTAWVLTALTEYIHASGELKGDFDFSAVLNEVPLASGSAGASETWQLIRATVPLSELEQETGNALRFIRSGGQGRLYYRAFLELDQPVEDAQPLEHGLTVSRDYILAGVDCQPQDCPAVESVSLQADNPVVIGRVTITNPVDRYYVVVEDAIPAGTEIINLNLNTSAYVFEETSDNPQFDPLEPFDNGWGWWWFDSPVIYDDHIRWIASYLPAGTYTLTYQLQPQLAGEFRVLPARAYAYYFPEVEGRSAGMIFTIRE